MARTSKRHVYNEPNRKLLGSIPKTQADILAAGLGGIRRHSQTERVHPPLMLVVESLESLSVSKFGSFDSVSFVELVALSLGFF